MSHGYRFMQRCFANCIGYVVSNMSQHGIGERGRNFIAGVKSNGATAPEGGGGNGFQEAAKGAEK
jgi:hypothetical protein